LYIGIYEYEGKEKGGEEQLEPEGRKRMIETDAAKGKAVLGNGRTWKRDNVVLKRTLG
jgi:hypothetical protein